MKKKYKIQLDIPINVSVVVIESKQSQTTLLAWNSKKQITYNITNTVSIELKPTTHTVQLSVNKRADVANLYTTRNILLEQMFHLLKRFQRKIFLEGIGYRFFYNKIKKMLFLKVGYFNKIPIKIPKLVQILVVGRKNNALIIRSRDLELLNIFCLTLYGIKIPDPYKGKGVYLDNINKKNKKVKKK